VYSYGVVLLELLSGRKPTDSSFSEEHVNLAGWVVNHSDPVRTDQTWHEMRGLLQPGDRSELDMFDLSCLAPGEEFAGEGSGTGGSGQVPARDGATPGARNSDGDCLQMRLSDAG
jgi:hypothetical protein